MRGKKRFYEFLRRSLERPNAIEIIVTLLLLCFAVITFSNTGHSFVHILVLFFGMMGIGIVWVARAVFHLVRHVILSENRKLALRRLAAWSVFPVIIVLMVGMEVKQHSLLEIRLRLSESALYDFVQSIPPDTDETFSEKKQWVGLFHVSEVQCLDGCVWFITARPFWDETGLVYCPEGKPPVVESDYYRHLYGPWWQWRRDW